MLILTIPEMCITTINIKLHLLWIFNEQLLNKLHRLASDTFEHFDGKLDPTIGYVTKRLLLIVRTKGTVAR